MARPIVVIHFQPLELYPPVLNLINYLNEYFPNKKVIVLTLHSSNGVLSQFKSPGKQIRILRLGKMGGNLSSAVRYTSYFFFYILSLLRIFLIKPSAILYFESLSSYPAYLYRKYFNRKVKIFIHYHEYTSAIEYEKGMKLVRFFHKREKRIYGDVSWISHTNYDRMKFFMIDESIDNMQSLRVMPNYPPRAWNIKPKTSNPNCIKIVYAGALSLDTMYTKEFAQWVINQNGRVIWDIYSHNTTNDAHDFLDNVSCPFINIYKGINYLDLPDILSKYQIGVILYNGHIPNYIYNAPNKLFEYMALKLDIWFPNVMLGCLPYVTQKTYPRVVGLDFHKLDKIDLEKIVDRSGMSYKSSNFFSEDIYFDLTSMLFYGH